MVRMSTALKASLVARSAWRSLPLSVFATASVLASSSARGTDMVVNPISTERFPSNCSPVRL